MAEISPKNTGLEIRMDMGGRLTAYHNGERLPGVISINVSHELGERAVTTIKFHGMATRLVTEDAVISTEKGASE